MLEIEEQVDETELVKAHAGQGGQRLPGPNRSSRAREPRVLPSTDVDVTGTALAEVADLSSCDVTTIGRRSGRPHTIAIALHPLPSTS